MTIDIEQLKADSRAGTYGPWIAQKYVGDKDGWFVRNVSRESVCGKGCGSLLEKDARRIARVPELEAAYIEAVECIISMVDAANSFQDEEGYQVASQVRIRANEFL